MGDDGEGEVKKYMYEGARQQGETREIESGEGDKRMTKEVLLDGPRQGKGTATFPDGSVYEGEFSDGARHGSGKYSYAAPPPGEEEEPKPPLGEYNGTWRGGVKEGVGVMVYANKAKYHGSWKDGKQDGTGTLYYPNGDIFTGSWHAGKKHGPGTYFFKASETKVTGVWDYNQLATGTFVDKFGNSYTGAFSGSADGVGYVAGGEFSLASGAQSTATTPTLAELAAELGAYDQDGNGVIDKYELKGFLTRPGSGSIAMSDEDAEAILSTLTALFDANDDGKLQIAEVASALMAQG